MTSIAAESKFVELVRGWLVSLPHDLKIAFDAMDDENLPRPVREVAAGVIAYVVSPNDFVSDRHDAIVSYADDAVLLRLALQKALGPGEDEQSFRERFPELFESLEENLTLCKSIMGELMTWLEGKVTTLPTLEYKARRSRSTSTMTRRASSCSKTGWCSAPTTPSTKKRSPTSSRRRPRSPR